MRHGDDLLMDYINEWNACGGGHIYYDVLEELVRPSEGRDDLVVQEIGDLYEASYIPFFTYRAFVKKQGNKSQYWYQNFHIPLTVYILLAEKNLTIEEGIELAKESLKSSMARDNASGNGMDIYTITKDGIKKVVSQTAESVYKDKE